MGKRVLRLGVCAVFALAVLIPLNLGAVEFKKLPKWGNAPKRDDGQMRGANTLLIMGKNNVYFGWSGGAMAHWDGKKFKGIKLPKKGNKWSIRQFVRVSKNDVWAFGDNGYILHYTGKGWKQIDNPLNGKGRREARLWGAGCAHAKRCFAGTRSGDVLEWNGVSWKISVKAGDPPPEGARVYAMAFPTKKSGWMTGASFFAGWNGETWKRVDVEAPRIYDMVMLDKNYGWAVGDGGAFFKFTGKTWEKVNVKGSFFRMRGVDCKNKNDCWAVGDAGAAFHWDGKGWTKVKTGTFDRMNRVRFGFGTGFMVTNKGDVLRVDK